jgi:hypothetical protein
MFSAAPLPPRFSGRLSAAAILAIALVNTGQAQTPRTLVPAPRPQIQPMGGSVVAPRFRLVLWANGRATVLNGLTGAAGPGGTALPTPEQIRANAMIRTKRPPGVVIISVLPQSAAGQALARLGQCKWPACAVEIDQLGPNGAVIGSHRFSNGSATAQTHTNELEEFDLTFQKIVFTNTIKSDSAQDDWSAQT